MLVNTSSIGVRQREDFSSSPSSLSTVSHMPEGFGVAYSRSWLRSVRAVSWWERHQVGENIRPDCTCALFAIWACPFFALLDFTLLLGSSSFRFFDTSVPRPRGGCSFHW